MLKDVYPDLSRVALMFNPDSAPYYDVYLRSFERIPRSIAVDVRAAPVRNTAEIEKVIAKLGQEPGSGLIAAADPFIVVQRDAILKSAKTHRVPTVSVSRQFVTEGGLMSYGPDPADIFRRAGSYIDRILRGEKAADLPVQSPTRFELVVNMITARALGLTVKDLPSAGRRGDRIGARFAAVHRVRYWHKADIALVAPHMSAIGDKADIRFCTAHVCF